jgi:hypothetical protein
MEDLRKRYEDVGSRWREGDFDSIRCPKRFGEFFRAINPKTDGLAKKVRVLGLMAGDASFELYFSHCLVSLGKRVELDILDFSSSMTAVAQSTESIALRKITRDVRDIRLATIKGEIEGENDFIILKFGLHDLPYDDQRMVLEEMPRLMSANGRLILVVYVSSTAEAQSHYNNIVMLKDSLIGYKTQRCFSTLGEIIDALGRAGFKRRIELESESKINYFKTELRDSRLRQIFREKIYQMDLMFGINKMLGISQAISGPEITFPLALITATKD